jgi:hypothetical protein
MNTFTQKMAIFVGFATIALAPLAKAGPWDQKTTFTFSGPVEIPGQILPAGTYVFKLADSSSNRHIVQIFNSDQSRIYGTFLAIPDYRLSPAEKPILNFTEREGDAPAAIRAWFYPGQYYGHEFVYPKKTALALAKANKVEVPAMPQELAADAAKPDAALDSPEVSALSEAPLTEEQPTGREIDLAAFFPPIHMHPFATLTENISTDAPEELPATASSEMAIGALGLLALGFAGVLAVGAAKAK